MAHGQESEVSWGRGVGMELFGREKAFECLSGGGGVGINQRNEHQTSETAEEQLKEVEGKVSQAELEIYTGREGKGREGTGQWG